MFSLIRIINPKEGIISESPPTPPRTTSWDKLFQQVPEQDWWHPDEGGCLYRGAAITKETQSAVNDRRLQERAGTRRSNTNDTRVNRGGDPVSAPRHPEGGKHWSDHLNPFVLAPGLWLGNRPAREEKRGTCVWTCLRLLGEAYFSPSDCCCKYLVKNILGRLYGFNISYFG